MSQNINWGMLVRNNRVKAVGIHWTKEELEAIKNGMDPEDVRNGFLTKKEVEDSKEKELPLEKRKKADIVLMAKELGITFDEAIATKGDLILEIKKTLEKKDPKNV